MKCSECGSESPNKTCVKCLAKQEAFKDMSEEVPDFDEYEFEIDQES